MKKTRAKLTPVKEVRARVSKLEDSLVKAGLTISSLKNEIESLEGARRNLKMMYDTHEMEKNKAIDERVSAENAVRSLNRAYQELNTELRDARLALIPYQHETATAMWVRSMKLALVPIRKAVSSFFERLSFRLRRRK